MQRFSEKMRNPKKVKKVVRKTPAKQVKAPTKQTKNFKISLIHKQGPYATEAQAMQRKAFLKKHVPHALFSKITGSGNKFSFMSKAERIEKLPAILTTAAIKAHVSTGVPGEKVSVTIVK